MEPIQPPAQQPVQNPVQAPSIQPKLNYFRIIFFPVLSILLISSIIYLYLQNQNLKKQVLKPPVFPTIQIPTSTSQSISPTPTTTSQAVSSISIPPDEMEDWEIYANNINGYSIKYPKNGYLRLICPDEELTVTNRGIDNQTSPVVMSTCARGGRYTLETKTYASIQAEPEETKYYKITKKGVQIDGIAGKLYIYTFTNIEVGPFPLWYVIARVNKNNKTYEIWFDEKDSLDLFNQILSTFKFTNINDLPKLSEEILLKGWYWGSEDQKKPETPTDWVYQEAGRSSCWHKPGVECL